MSKANRLYKVFMTSMIIVIAGLLLACGVIAVKNSMRVKMSIPANPNFLIEIYIQKDGSETQNLVFKNYGDVQIKNGFSSLSGNKLIANGDDFIKAYGGDFSIIIKNFTENMPMLVTVTSTATLANGNDGVPAEITAEKSAAVAYDKTTADEVKFNVANKAVFPQTTLIEINFEQIDGYVVSFNANGGSGTMPAQQHALAGSTALTECTFTAPAGKEFAGWAITSDGEVKYTDGQSVSNLKTKAGEGIVLYAVWREPGFAITLNLNGGAYNTSTNNITLSGVYSNLSSATSVVDDYIPTMTNYTFGGWYSDVVGATNVPTTQVKYYSCNYFTDNSISLAQDLTLTGPTTLYARWLPFIVGTYETGTDAPTESGNTVTYTAFAGYKYLKFVGVDSFTATYDSNVTPLRFIVIGAGEKVNSAMKGAYEQTSVTKAAFAGTLTNTKDTSAVGANTEIADNHVLLLSEQLVDRMFYCDNNANWLDTSATTRKFLNETTTATNFLPGSGLDDYVTNGFIVKPSTNTENATLANGIITAWSSGTTTDNDSCIFLLGSRYGSFDSGNASANGEIVSQTDNIKERYYSQHFVVEDYLGVDREGIEGGDLVYGDAKLKQFTGLNATYSAYWWLRSGDYNDYNHAYYVYSSGSVSGNFVYFGGGVRPSFILNLS